MKSKGITLLLIACIIFSLFIGCTPQKRPAPAPTPAPKKSLTQKETKMTTDNTVKARTVADMIVKKHTDINSATVVLADTKAYVGIDLKANLSKTSAEKIKKDVADIVRNQDTRVKTVYVTEDADTVTRLKKVAKDTESGKPISGFLNELETMFKRITPSTK